MTDESLKQEVDVIYNETTTHFEFPSAIGDDEERLAMADVISKICGIDPLTSQDGVVICSARWLNDDSSRYHLWNSSMGLEDWRRRVFFQIDANRMYVYRRDEVADWVSDMWCNMQHL